MRGDIMLMRGDIMLMRGDIMLMRGDIMKKGRSIVKSKNLLINMTLKKLVQASSFIWFKAFVLRKDMEIIKPNLNCHQETSLSMISSMEKLICLRET